MSAIISLLYWLAIIAGALGLIAFLLRRLFQRDSRRDQMVYVDTDDGWRLALAHYAAEKNADGAPVLLCPGLATNCGIFERGEVPLVRYLGEQGYQVWALDLRGRGASSKPRIFGSYRRSWSFESYVAFDLPAAIAAVQQRSQGRPVHLLGFGLGGAAILALLSGALDCRSSVASASTLGSHLNFRRLSSVVSPRLLRLLRVIPLRGLVRLLTPLLGRFAFWPFSLLWSTDNVDGATLRALLANDIDGPSRLEVVQLSRWIEAEIGSVADDGRDYNKALGELDTPTLMIAGARDRIAPAAAVQATLEQLGCQQKTGIIAGRQRGMSANYGHFDLLLGRAAARDVFVNLVEFLRAIDGDQRDPRAAVGAQAPLAEPNTKLAEELDQLAGDDDPDDDDPYELAMGDVPSVPQDRDQPPGS